MTFACILLGGPTYTIDGMPFEWHPRFGPAVVDHDGRILDRQPGPRHRFWQAIDWWREQGCRVDENGACIYEEPPTPVYAQIVGSIYVEVPPGRTPEDVRREWLAKAERKPKP